jgi:hypothetical protein
MAVKLVICGYDEFDRNKADDGCGHKWEERANETGVCPVCGRGPWRSRYKLWEGHKCVTTIAHIVN